MSKQYFQVAFFCMSVNLTLLCYNEKLICPICTSKFKRFLRNFIYFLLLHFRVRWSTLTLPPRRLFIFIIENYYVLIHQCLFFLRYRYQSILYNYFHNKKEIFFFSRYCLLLITFHVFIYAFTFFRFTKRRC